MLEPFATRHLAEMSGRALKGARLAKGVLGRMRDRIKHGVQQPPAWYENVRRSPPAPLPRAPCR